jgi:hypothetical protein
LSNGNYQHQHVFRGFINSGGTWGEPIDASQTGVITRTVTYTLPAAINGIPLNIGELEFFSFLHEGHNALADSKVLTCAEIEPVLTNMPTPNASLNSIINAFNVCAGETITPVVKVINSGDAITSLQFSSSINGGTPVVYDWTGTIDALGYTEITLPQMSFTVAGANSLVVNIASVNGGTGTLGSVVTQTKPIAIATEATVNNVTVKMTTDRYGSETSWKIFNSAGTVVGEGGPFTNATANGAYPQPDVNLVLPNDCYRAVVYDSYGDGFDSGYGNGNFEVTGGIQIASITTFATGASASDAMKINATAEIGEFAASLGLNTFPNPATDHLSVAFTAENTADYTVTLLDLQGRVVSSTVYAALSGEQVIEIPVFEMAKGNYIVSVSSSEGAAVQHVTIQ